MCVYKIAGCLCLGMDFSALFVRYGMCEKLFGSLLSKGLSQSALCDVINVEQHIMSFLP